MLLGPLKRLQHVGVRFQDKNRNTKLSVWRKRNIFESKEGQHFGPLLGCPRSGKIAEKRSQMASISSTVLYGYY